MIDTNNSIPITISILRNEIATDIFKVNKYNLSQKCAYNRYINFVAYKQMMNILWDWISVSSVAIILFPILHFLLTFDPAYIACFIGLAATSLLTTYMKHATYRAIDADWVRRPEGALNCDILCRNGDNSGAPGFPSGHMSHAAFFGTFITILAIKRKLPNKFVIFGVSLLYTVLTALARYHKHCHNIEQIVAGAFLGAILAIPVAAVASSWHHN